MQEREEVVRVPIEEAALPICAEEVFERGVLPVVQVAVLAEPLAIRTGE